MTTYSTSGHAKYTNTYHIVWITKCRYKVLNRAMKLRLKLIIHQKCIQLGVRILNGVLSSNHIHMFIEIPPKRSVSDCMKRIKGSSSYKIQKEFPELKKRYWGRRFWARGFFCTTSGDVTKENIDNYIDNHTGE